MMAGIIEEQRVLRRRQPSLLYRVLKRKPAAYNAGFIRQVKQKPARTRRHVPETAVFHAGIFRRLFSRPSVAGGTGIAGTPWGNGRAPRQERAAKRGQPEKRGPGFSIPLPSLMTLALIAGTIGVSLCALNWKDFSLPAAGTFSLEPGPDAEIQRNLASYAGLPSLDIPAEVSPVAEDIPLDLTETFVWSSYQVQRGDSVSKIAARFSLSIDAVIASNNISNARRLQEGELLRIPNMDGIPYTVKRGDSLSKISRSMGVPLEVILDANDIRSEAIGQGETLFIPGARMNPEALKRALGELFIYPIRGRLSSPFGWRNDPITGVRRYHAALDLAAGIGTPVKAAMDGTVSVASVDRVYGKFIILVHTGGYQTLYAHLSTAAVKKGDQVKQGSKIGEVGNTGYSTGPHLHFAVFKNGRPLNPLDML
jgi:murein DD-endopeptidase MepM/ murein hydrolase activator NlpD